jgi:starvation-inducible DNA-binding protein
MRRNSSTKTSELLQRREAPLATQTDLTPSATKDIAGAMNAILADVFALYLKTKKFHWHMSGPHFRDYHLLLDEHGDQLFAMTDPIAAARCLSHFGFAPRCAELRGFAAQNFQTVEETVNA